MRQAMKRTLTRMLKRTLAQSFGTWASATRTAQTNRCLLERAVARITSQAVAGAFERWQAHTDEHRKYSRIAQRVVARWNEGAVARAFESWWETCQGYVKARSLLRRVMNRAAFMAFGGWQSSAKTRARNRAKLEKTLARIAQTQTAKAWNTWTHFCRKVSVARRAISKLRVASVRRTLVYWRRAVQVRRRFTQAQEIATIHQLYSNQIQRIQTRVVNDWKRGQLAKVFSSLLQHALRNAKELGSVRFAQSFGQQRRFATILKRLAVRAVVARSFYCWLRHVLWSIERARAFREQAIRAPAPQVSVGQRGGTDVKMREVSQALGAIAGQMGAIAHNTVLPQDLAELQAMTTQALATDSSTSAAAALRRGGGVTISFGK